MIRRLCKFGVLTWDRRRDHPLHATPGWSGWEWTELGEAVWCPLLSTLRYCCCWPLSRSSLASSRSSTSRLSGSRSSGNCCSSGWKIRVLIYRWLFCKKNASYLCDYLINLQFLQFIEKIFLFFFYYYRKKGEIFRFGQWRSITFLIETSRATEWAKCTQRKERKSFAIPSFSRGYGIVLTIYTNISVNCYFIYLVFNSKIEDEYDLCYSLLARSVVPPGKRV